jgi:hypothetical protein
MAKSQISIVPSDIVLNSSAVNNHLAALGFNDDAVLKLKSAVYTAVCRATAQLSKDGEDVTKRKFKPAIKKGAFSFKLGESVKFELDGKACVACRFITFVNGMADVEEYAGVVKLTETPFDDWLKKFVVVEPSAP